MLVAEIGWIKFHAGDVDKLAADEGSLAVRLKSPMRYRKRMVTLGVLVFWATYLGKEEIAFGVGMMDLEVEPCPLVSSFCELLSAEETEN